MTDTLSGMNGILSPSVCKLSCMNVTLSSLAYSSLKTIMYNNINMEILQRSGCASSPEPMPSGIELSRCKRNCILCIDQMNPNTVFTSAVTNETFSFNGKGLSTRPCETKQKVVYLITCELCNIQYVGMTTTRWKDRFHGHRGCINRRKFGITLYEHFLNVGHTYHHCKVQVIFVCDSNCDDINKTLLTVEEYYMVKLATVYPYGLNDKLESKNIVLSSFDFRDFHKLNTPFFTFPSVRRSLSHDHRKNSSQCISLPIASETIDTVFNLYKTNKLHELYILLRSLSHSHIDDCLLNIEDYVKNWYG